MSQPRLPRMTQPWLPWMTQRAARMVGSPVSRIDATLVTGESGPVVLSLVVLLQRA